MLSTTLNQLNSNRFGQMLVEDLLNGSENPDAQRVQGDQEIPLLDILDRFGVDETLWAMGMVPEGQIEQRDRIAWLFGLDCHEHINPDNPDIKGLREEILSKKYTTEVLAYAQEVGSHTQIEIEALGIPAWVAKDTAAVCASKAGQKLELEAQTKSDRLWNTGWRKEREWQAERLRQYLVGEV